MKGYKKKVLMLLKKSFIIFFGDILSYLLKHRILKDEQNEVLDKKKN